MLPNRRTLSARATGTAPTEARLSEQARCVAAYRARGQQIALRETFGCALSKARPIEPWTKSETLAECFGLRPSASHPFAPRARPSRRRASRLLRSPSLNPHETPKLARVSLRWRAGDVYMPGLQGQVMLRSLGLFLVAGLVGRGRRLGLRVA